MNLISIINSKLATILASFVLRCSNWPGRQIAGIGYRWASRLHGGKGFKVFSKDGTKLAAWYIPSQSGEEKEDVNSASPNPRPPIIMMHGWLELKEPHFKRATY